YIRTSSDRHLLSFPTRRSSDLAIQSPYCVAISAWQGASRNTSAYPFAVILFAHTSTARIGVPVLWTTSISARNTELWNSPKMAEDRKSTRLNSSHVKISYAVFC